MIHCCLRDWWDFPDWRPVTAGCDNSHHYYRKWVKTLLLFGCGNDSIIFILPVYLRPKVMWIIKVEVFI